MAHQELRRSERLGTYDSNGRDYLSSKLAWCRRQFEEWVYSATVRPILQDFYTLCIDDSQHFNEAVEWINTGPKGYFYNEGDLEEDLLLICLCAGNDGKAEDWCEDTSIKFNGEDGAAKSWLTQELWARAAWRIVQSNCSEEQVFHSFIHDRPAAAYGFAIEMLCIMFHSVAFRSTDSVYLQLLAGGNMKVTTSGKQAAKGTGLHRNNELDTTTNYTNTSDSSAADRMSDATFAEHKSKTVESERSIIVLPIQAGGNGLAIGIIDDVGSDILMSPRNNVEASITSSTRISHASSIDFPDDQEPLTPDTNASLRSRFGKEEVPNNEQVHQWLTRL